MKMANRATGGRRRQPGRRWRTAAALLTVVASVGTAAAFLVVALIIATYNCEDGCAVGSRWEPGAWGSTVELWVLALPAVAVALALVWAIATGRHRISLAAWSVMSALLIGWCVFTGVSTVTVDFSASNSHWMWLAGLVLACGGGLAGIFLARLGSGPPQAST